MSLEFNARWNNFSTTELFGVGKPLTRKNSYRGGDEHDASDSRCEDDSKTRNKIVMVRQRLEKWEIMCIVGCS